MRLQLHIFSKLVILLVSLATTRQKTLLHTNT